MAYYVILANFTDQGVRTIKELPKRADAFKAMAEKNGDDIAATALSLSVTALGNIRTRTLRAFDANHMRESSARCLEFVKVSGSGPAPL